MENDHANDLNISQSRKLFLNIFIPCQTSKKLISDRVVICSQIKPSALGSTTWDWQTKV